jgi:hypothetical protein
LLTARAADEVEDAVETLLVLGRAARGYHVSYGLLDNLRLLAAGEAEQESKNGEDEAVGQHSDPKAIWSICTKRRTDSTQSLADEIIKGTGRTQDRRGHGAADEILTASSTA